MTGLTRRALLGFAGGMIAAPAIASTPKRSVLFITVDDLNDFPSPFGGYPGIVSPAFARLAAMGATFKAAMAHVPACSPSRGSMMSGMAAWKTGVYTNSSNHLHGRYPAGHRYLPGYFRSNGGPVRYCGKLYHGVNHRNPPNDYDSFYAPANYKISFHDLGVHRSQVAADQDKDNQYDFGPGVLGGEFDRQITDWTIARMQGAMLTSNQQAFLGCGLYRPHLPHVVPQAYFDLYPQKPAVPPGYWPGAETYSGNKPDRKDLPARALGKHGIGPMLDKFDEHDAYLRSYLASVSFADAQIGRMLDAYEALGLAENTYLIVTSDHGYMLGEKMAFSKFALWERALRVPLIIVGPGIKGGRVQHKPVSLLDLYPTICALVDLPIPSWCDGRNLAPWLLGKKRLIDQGVVSVWRQGGRNYWRSRNRLGSFIHNGGGPAEAYDHNRKSARYDRHEFHNIVETMDPKLKRKLKSLAPPRWARTV